MGVGFGGDSSHCCVLADMRLKQACLRRLQDDENALR
jgi:hypothetical protein